MQYTEQLFDDIFPKFLEDRQKTYLNGKVSICEISHFSKTFAVEFFNEKSKHLNLDDLEQNQRQGQEQII